MCMLEQMWDSLCICQSWHVQVMCVIIGVVKPIGASEQIWTIKCYHACSGFYGCSASTGICAWGLGSQPEDEVTVGSQEWACTCLGMWNPCPNWRGRGRGILSKVESAQKCSHKGQRNFFGVTQTRCPFNTVHILQVTTLEITPS